ncbi:MAG TPA: DUF2336 domain-containing protein [Micropepsaceae bacterium]
MSAPHSKLVMLADMAAEASGDARRELLRQIADSFRPENTALNRINRADLDKIMSAIICEFTIAIRTELSRYIAASPLPFNATARNLALDEISVARPVLERSTALTDQDLLEVIAQKSQAHMTAVAKRAHVSEDVCEALVEYGEDRVVASLLDNAGAKIAYGTYEKVAARAETSVLLQGPFIQRSTVPLDLLNDLYFKVEGDLRRQVLEHFETASKQDLSVALVLSRRRWLVKYGGLPKNYETLSSRIDEFHRRGELKPAMLVGYLRSHLHTEFKLGFAKLTGTDYELVNRLVERNDLDGVAILARAGNFDRAFFVTVAMMLSGGGNRMADAESFGAQYEAISVEQASRVVRMWRVGPESEARQPVRLAS